MPGAASPSLTKDRRVPEGRAVAVALVRLVRLVRLVTLAGLFGAAGLLLWSLLPMALGWSAHVILSGSMAPNVQPGDVLLAQPIEQERLRPGMITLFERPGEPGAVVSHRVVRVEPDGRLLTQGDANAEPDTDLVPADRVEGIARLRVPFVGLPVLWLRQGDVRALGLLAITVCSASVLATGSTRLDGRDAGTTAALTGD